MGPEEYGARRRFFSEGYLRELPMTLNTEKRTLLLVEDEALIAMAGSVLLEKHGYRVVTASSGEKAIDIALNLPEIDLILMDIDLGRGMDGTAAAEQILKDRDLPVVFLSSHTEPGVVEKTEKITSYGYVVKNSGETVLLASIRMAFRLFLTKQESRKHEGLLAETTQHLKEAQAIAGLGRWDYYHDNYLLVWSDTIFTIFDIEADEFGESLESFLGMVHPGDREMVAEAWRRSLTDRQPYTIEHRVLHRDGRITWVLEKCRTEFEENGRPVHSVGIVQDITERKQTEAELQAVLYELEKSQEVAKVSNWIWHIPENKVLWSDQMYRIFGIEKEHFSGDLSQVIAESIHPDDQDKVDRSNASVVSSNKPIPVEYRVVRPDGTIRWVWAEAGELELDGEGSPVLLRGIVLDITARKEAEDALRASETLLSRSENLTQSGGWELDIKNDIFTGTQGWQEIHGLYRTPLSSEELFSLAHPEDLPRIREELLRAQEGGGLYTIEHRIIRRDTGEVRTIRAFGEAIRDSNNEAQRIYGAVQDITSQKALEESRQISQKAFAASMDAIALADLQGMLTYVNPAFLSLWGYQTASQVLGQKALNFWEFGEKAQSVVDSLHDTGVWSGELSGKRQDGSVFDVQLSSSMVLDDRGNPLCMMGMFRDISGRKREEEKIQTLLREKELLLRETHHRIKNNYVAVESLLALQLDQAVHPEVQTALRNAKTRISGMSLLYDKLLKAGQFQHVSTKAYLEDLGASVLAAHDNSGMVGLRTDIEERELDAARVLPVGAIVTELMINSLKHAYRPGESGMITVTLAYNDGEGSLRVSDDGKGMPEDHGSSAPDSFGLMLVRMMADQLGGSLSCHSRPGKGTIFTVDFAV
jgi:PAS domain S-box-containing protein